MTHCALYTGPIRKANDQKLLVESSWDKKAGGFVHWMRSQSCMPPLRTQGMCRLYVRFMWLQGVCLKGPFYVIISTQLISESLGTRPSPMKAVPEAHTFVLMERESSLGNSLRRGLWTILQTTIVSPPVDALSLKTKCIPPGTSPGNVRGGYD
jgi:hypothetical protein